MDQVNQSLLDELKEYAEREFSNELTNILMVDDSRQYHSINVDTMSLFFSCLSFAHYLFECPENALKLLNDAFLQAALSISRIQNLKTSLNKESKIYVRLTSLPNLPEINRTSLPSCSDVGQFMCISGTITRITTSKMLEYRKLWKCKKCKYDFTIDAEVESGYICEKPVVCPNPEWCNGKNFTLLSTDDNPSYCKDYQEVKIQEQVHNLNIGSVPKSMWVILEDDLVETCHPGNDVNVSGILIQRWKPLFKGKFIDIDLVLFAHNVEVKNKMTHSTVSENVLQEVWKFWVDYKNDPLKGRDIILSSICPQLFGLYIVKLAVALVLAGGVERKDENSRIRGDSHLLLVGDPGTGKSQFLKYATKVSMRSVLTSGIGTTNAGLTVSAVKEAGKWQLEAGALVLADGGVCCIDEFSCIKEHDKTCIHEAMEQQTISVAKAGLVCTLSTRCSILAATNPKGKYDENLSISENTALASPLLSRFDIILVLLDNCDENWDRLVSSFILEGRNMSENNGNESTWSLEKMRQYFSLIRYISPRITPSCEKVLQAYYKRQRSSEANNLGRTTPRLLQSLIRLAEGHARLMLRDQVLIIDAVIAIVLMESSMSGSSVLKDLSDIHTSFPENPKSDYDAIEKTVLTHLNLNTIPIDFENTLFSCQESCIRQLVSEISIACKSSQKDLFASSETNGSRISSISALNQESDEIAMISPRKSDQLKLPRTDETESSTDNNLTNKTGDCSSFQIPSFSCNATTNDNQFLTEVHGETLYRPLLNKGSSSMRDVLKDEVSTLSDVKHIFCDNFVESEGTIENNTENIFQRKASSGTSETNVSKAITTKRYTEDPTTSKQKSTSPPTQSEKGYFQKVTGITSDNKCKSSSSSSASGKKKENPLQKFAFQNRASRNKGALVSDKKCDSDISSAAQNISDTFNHNGNPSQSKTQSSQSVFKRFFSKSVQNIDSLDLDDLSL